MTCKDCLHYGVCYTQETCNDIKQQLKDFGCDNFTDRSEWIHLSCKAGDTVYYITGIHNQLIKSATIKEITFDQNKIVSLFVIDENGISFENDANIFYLLYEEAEKALND